MERHARLKILRILHGFTQTEFAQMANIPAQSISAMETGKYAPAGETGMLVAMALRVPYDYLYVGAPSVDYAAPCLWKPAPPVRSQHLQAMSNEVEILFPLFLIENEFDTMVSARLSGGDFAFLIGRRPKDNRLKVKVSCLLLVSERLASSFLSAFETAGVSGPPSIPLECTIDSFDFDALSSMVVKAKVKCDTLGLTTKLIPTENSEESSPAVKHKPAGDRFSDIQRWLQEVSESPDPVLKAAVVSFVEQNVHFDFWKNKR